MGLAAFCFLVGFISKVPHMYGQYKFHRALRQKQLEWARELDREMERGG
jgi:hypothetical protein